MSLSPLDLGVKAQEFLHSTLSDLKGEDAQSIRDPSSSLEAAGLSPGQVSQAILHRFRLSIDCNGETTIGELNSAVSELAKSNDYGRVINNHAKRNLRVERGDLQIAGKYKLPGSRSITDLTSGDKIGPYTIQRTLGRGAFKIVYLATDKKKNTVALHLGDVTGGGRFLDRNTTITNERSSKWVSPDEKPAEAVFFRRGGIRVDFFDLHEIDQKLWHEACVLSSCPHSCFPKLLNIIEVNGRVSLVTEYVEGQTLRERMRADGRIKLGWFLNIAETLMELQRSGLTWHGDLKPENILVSPEERVIVIDPAYDFDGEHMFETTPTYNPLLLRNSKADVMALGIMLYESWTQALPFETTPFTGMYPYAGSETDNLHLEWALSYRKPSDIDPHCRGRLETIIYNAIVVPNYGLGDLRADLRQLLAK